MARQPPRRGDPRRAGADSALACHQRREDPRHPRPGYLLSVPRRPCSAHAAGIDEQVRKAERAVDGHAPVKRNRYIQLTGAAKSVNRTLEAKTRALAGWKG